MNERTRQMLLWGTGLVAVLQVLHSVDVLRYADDASLVRLMLAPDLVLGVGAVLIAFALLARRSRAARLWSIAGPLLVVAGFVQHHMLPTYSGGANPYWTFDEGFRGDFIRWLTVVAIIVVGVWTAWQAWQAKATELTAS